jgi:hypothetical protein
LPGCLALRRIAGAPESSRSLPIVVSPSELLEIDDRCNGTVLEDLNQRWALCPITVRNRSQEELTGVAVRIENPPPQADLAIVLSCELGRLAPGESKICEVDLTAGAKDVAPGVSYLVQTPLGPVHREFKPVIKPHEAPLAIGGLALWLRADSLDGQDDGSEVAAWTDLSGNANDAAQATATLRPLVYKNAFNGKTAVWFDGTDDVLSIPDSESLWPTELTVVTVASFDVVQNRRQMLVSKISTPEWDSFLLFYEGGRSLFSVMDSATGIWPIWRKSFTYAANQPMILQGHYKASTFDALDGASRVNGQESVADYTANGNRAGFTIEYTDRPLELGRHVAGNGVPNSHFLGNMAEVLIFNKALSTIEKAMLDSYLAAKYGAAIQ